MSKIYVLEIKDYYAGEQNNNVLLFSSYKKAIKSLKELRDDFFKNYDIVYYIIDDDREYSFDCYRNSQGDGLSFSCDNFLTDKVLSLIDAKLDKNEKRMWHTMLKQDSIKIYSTGNTGYYDYASRHDVDYYNYIQLTEKQEKVLDKVIDICRDIYMNECGELENKGYDCYNVDVDMIIDELCSQEYYEDGNVYYV